MSFLTFLFFDQLWVKEFYLKFVEFVSFTRFLWACFVYKNFEFDEFCLQNFEFGEFCLQKL